MVWGVLWGEGAQLSLDVSKVDFVVDQASRRRTDLCASPRIAGPEFRLSSGQPDCRGSE